MSIKEYIIEIDRLHATGSATEHSYRPALELLLKTMLSALTVINEPKRMNCGAPDYILLRGDVPVAFIEAKDFANTHDLTGRKENKEQFDRYKKSLNNLIFTDYLDFLLYEGGEFVDSVKLAEVKGERVVAIKENEGKFTALIERLGNATSQKITSSARLAQVMAGKARLLADVIEKSLNQDSAGNSDLCGQMNAFREVLIHDITPKTFADIYSQTIAYGMFAARLHDTTPDTFSRMEAATLIPKTNPFLRRIFQSIAGYDLDERIAWIVDDLAEAFRATDVVRVMSGYGKRTRQTDPILHFYEDFLSAYDPALRKSRGVWYTPQPIVSYIVRAVDEILQKEFALPMGLADTSKTRATLLNQKSKKRDKDTYQLEVHKVQVLDPATGTGTFLAEVVDCIHKRFEGQQGAWQSYVDEHLLPRLNGFELLMASYAMAHLKLDMILSETGYVPNTNKRLRVYLTNSLEEHHADMGSLFVQELANEANQANHIKRDTPVMVVVGNPPYSGVSSNNGKWITGLINDYKSVNGVPLGERKHWLNDDYVKFIRLGQAFVDKNNEGVLAYVNNHSFLDNATFRGMRWHLLRSFDKIYIIDLHGNSKKKEACLDGSKDENVFDIQQGVSINIFVKTGQKTKGALADVFHLDLFGKRQSKYDYLAEHELSDTPFVKLTPNEPFYFFVPKSEANRGEYEQGFKVDELFPINTTGVVTMGDSFAVSDSKQQLEERLNNFVTSNTTASILNEKYNLGKNYADFILKNKSKLIIQNDNFVKIDCRPFDTQWTYFDNKIIWRPRTKIFQHFLNGCNIGLVVARQCVSDWRYVFITDKICEFNLTGTAGRFGSGCVFPLYLYQTDSQTSTDNNNRKPNLKPNLKPEIINAIARELGLQFEPEKSGDDDKFAPIDLLDYIYGVLHTPAYRERYMEFLKIDFPHVPYPKDIVKFRTTAIIGGQLRRLHLMEELPPLITKFSVEGSDLIESVKVSKTDQQGNLQVWINDTQYFDDVPLIAWEFYIGGYQPAQKWLKDRRGRTLNFDDIIHYQRIVAALMQTNDLMQML